MQRYQPDFRMAEMVDDVEGEYVEYADAQAALSAKDSRIEALRNYLSDTIALKDALTQELERVKLERGTYACPECGCVGPHGHTGGRWMGIDFDRTLSQESPRTPYDVGEPIQAMVDKVKGFIRDGIEVRIVTARVAPTKDGRDMQRVVQVIQDWCEKHIGHRLPVTAIKGHGLIKLYDDKAVNPAAEQAHADLLKEAVWAMEQLQHTLVWCGDDRSDPYFRTLDFLSSPLVTDWRARQEEQKVKPIPDSEDESTDWAHLDRDER